MLVGPAGEAVGSVSGGCVEGAVYDLAQGIVASGEPELQRYGVSDDDAFAVGLTCGGILDVYVEKVDQQTFPELGAIADDVEAGRPVAVATVVEHPDPSWVGRRIVVRPDEGVPPGRSGSPRADGAVADDALGMLASGHSQTLTYGPDGERRGEGMRVFVWSFAPAPRMLVFGAIDFAAAVARMGNFLGYKVTVCDARPVFATNSRFPSADEVVVKWPHKYLREEIAAGRIDQRTVLCVLTHDPKFDVPLLEVALRRGRRGVRRRDGLASHPRGPDGPARGGRTHRRRSSAGCPRRSAWTSAPARPRRPRSASPRRSSPSSGAGRASGWRRRRAASTTDPRKRLCGWSRRARRAGVSTGRVCGWSRRAERWRSPSRDPSGGTRLAGHR